ncbi:MAG: hypothetical protein M5U10_03285 [Candidatus Methanoperedens sp.]|nr:hypothetical protein [Candidatus Methanoperedens nitroreducens]MDJ1420922.1 hypothetical protein [Candidatus Methanoperedens sp.]
MMKLKAEPYTLRLRPDVQKSEQALRRNLNLLWCSGVLFNVLAFKNMANKVEFDAVLWNDEAILFIEYKDSPSMYKNMEAKRAQQIKGYSRNIARAFGFQKYNFIIVVNGLEQRVEKGSAAVIPLNELINYVPGFESSLEELDYIDWLLSKYNRQENPVEFTKELVLKELKILRDKIKQINK